MPNKQDNRRPKDDHSTTAEGSAKTPRARPADDLTHAFFSEKSNVLHLSGLPQDITQARLESWFTQHGGRPTTFWAVYDPHNGFAVFFSHREVGGDLTRHLDSLWECALT